MGQDLRTKTWARELGVTSIKIFTEAMKMNELEEIN